MDTDRTARRLLVAGGLLAFVMLGWTGILMPALIRDIEADLRVGDADMGTVYLLFSISFTAGCLLAGWIVARVGRRAMLLGATGLLVAGSIAVLVPSWPAFLVAATMRGVGSGIIEVGIQGLFLYAFAGPTQGRAINSVHFSYSVGAALAPVAIAALLATGLGWTAAMALTALPWCVAAVLLAIAPMEARPPRGSAPPAGVSLSVALVAAAVAISLYVGAEAGVSSWLVRFLQDADLGLAASALTLFWTALAVSRLIVSRIGHRAAPEVLAIGGSLVAAAAIVGGVVAPAVPVSIALFALAGFAFGPVYPGIILLGSRIPGRKDAVTGLIASSGVAGSTIYPPLMGVISLGPGLGVAMAGTAAIAVAGAGLVLVAARAIQAGEGTAAVKAAA